MTFEEQVEQELEKLNYKQKVHLAWHFSVRVLPLLGFRGNFDYWKKEDRQTYLYVTLNALDEAAVGCEVAYTPFFATDFRSDYDFITAYNVAKDSEPLIVSCVLHVAASVAYHAGYIRGLLANPKDDYKVELTAAYKAAYEAVTLASDAFSMVGIKDIQSILLNDIKLISENKSPSISFDIYGEIWNGFRQALKSEGCEYWGKLYQNIFENNIACDAAALMRRMSVPKEIQVQGAAAVARHLEKIEKEGAERLNEARILILGEKGAGKTCVARRLKDPDAPMTTVEESTAGVDTSLWALKEDDINVRIWDFAGHTVTHAVHQFFLSERCLYIMVYDGRTEGRNRLKYWLDQMENYGGDSKAFILVNERDEHKIDIPINSLKEKYPIEKVYAFNVEKDREQLEAFRRDVADFIKNNPSWKNQEIPLSYYQVKEELEARFDPKDEQAGAEHITKADFIDIARKHQVEEPEKLLKDLHYLGVSLWYADMDEYETLVLNPEWISQGVYRIINWVSNAQTHTLTMDCFAKVFADNARYPADKHKFLFNLMKHYELAYETTGGSRLVIPHLLKEDQLADLPKFDVEDSLMLKYEADQALPPHTISRFIVRHNQQIQSEGDKMNVWRYGVILEDGKGSLALVREKDREISVSVKGNDKTAFISTLRESLNAIFESYKSKRPELVYRVIDNTLPQQELWLDERKIVNHVLNNQPYYNDITNQNLPLQPVINIYQIQVSGNQPVIIGGQDNRLIQNIFNFKDCNIELQGELTELSRKLKREGLEEDAIELVEAVEILEEIEGASKEEVKKKGIAKKLRRIVEDLGDDKSPLGKAIKGVRHGVDIAQDIGKQYNKMAQWLGMPQVPDLFLGGDGKE